MRRRSTRYTRRYSIDSFPSDNQNQIWVRFRNRVFRTKNLRENGKSLILTTLFWLYIIVLSSGVSNFPYPTMLPVILLLVIFPSFIILMQINSWFHSKLANDILVNRNDKNANLWAASKYMDAAEFRLAASLLFDYLNQEAISEYWGYTEKIGEYLEAVDALPLRTKAETLYTDATKISADNNDLFLDFFSLILLLPKTAFTQSELDELMDRFSMTIEGIDKQKESGVSIKSTLIESTKYAIQGNWSESLKTLMEIWDKRWSDSPVALRLYNALKSMAYQLDTPKWFLSLQAYQANADYFSYAIYKSIVNVVYTRWDEDGLVDYMKFVASFPDTLVNRFAPSYVILFDVLELTKSQKMKSFIVDNLSLLLGYTPNEKFMSPKNVLEMILTRNYEDYVFLKDLLEKAMSLTEDFPEITEIIANQARLFGFLRNSKDMTSIWFFETAVIMGMNLKDKTMAFSSIDYLVQIYFEYFKKGEYKIHVENLLDTCKEETDICASILASTIERTHDKGLIEDCNHFLSTYELLSHSSFLSDGRVYFVKYKIAEQKDNFALVITLLDKSADSFSQAEKNKEAGLIWQFAGSRSWQQEDPKKMIFFYEKAITSFDKAEECWRQVTLQAAINRWSDVITVIENRMHKIAIRLKEIEVIPDSNLDVVFFSREQLKKERIYLQSEQKVIEIVLDACMSIIEWDNDNYSYVLTKLPEIIIQLKKLNLVHSHPAAGFVLALQTVLGYYASLSHSATSIQKGNFQNAYEEIDSLIQNFNTQISMAAAIHKPYLETLKHVVQALQRLATALNPNISDKEKSEAENAAAIDLKMVREIFANLEMNEEVEKIDKILEGFPLGRGTAYPLSLALKIPLFPNVKIQSGFDLSKYVSTKTPIQTALASILYTGRGMEQKAKSFAKYSEDGLKEILVLDLGRYFHGLVTSETKRRTGKTDIHISQSDRPPLVMECKCWNGPSYYDKAILQLFGYLLLTDVEAFLITFCINGTFSTILESAKNTIINHETYIEGSLHIEEHTENYIIAKHTHPSDSTKNVTLHHILFNLII